MFREIGLLKCIFAIGFLSFSAYCQAPYIIPQPREMRIDAGSFTINGSTAIVTSDTFLGIGQYLSDFLAIPTGFSLPVSGISGAYPVHSIVIDTVHDSALGTEGYSLQVLPDKIIIRAQGGAGAFYACQTLRQMLPLCIESQTAMADTQWTVPCAAIRDWPCFPWRGCLLDVGRHFRSKAYVKKYIDLLSYHKMNRFHWHLTEDQGWRIEILGKPKLTQIGAWREDGSGGTYGGYYSQDDVREIVAYAQSKFVEIVPEIEMPGHCMAALASYPELSCTGGPFVVPTSWGIKEDVYCAGNDSVFTFLEDVLDEVVSLFPSQWIHIGGDECPKARWQACPKCQARMVAEGLADENELQSYFIQRIENYLQTKNKRIIGWDEILAGGLAQNATVQSWRGETGGISAAAAGHDAIMSPQSHCYLDYSYSSISMLQALSYNPIPATLPDSAKKYILGLEGCMWGESTPTDSIVDRQTFPRLCALAEAAWLPDSAKDWNSFRDRIGVHGIRLDYLGVKFYHALEIYWGMPLPKDEVIPQAGCSLQYVDSEEHTAENGSAANAFDGDYATIWHTAYTDSQPVPPHEIQINLGADYTICAFDYLPRQTGSQNGQIQNYEFYTSMDGAAWGTPVAQGTLDISTRLGQKITFQPVIARYIRLVALSGVGIWTTVAEINLLEYQGSKAAPVNTRVETHTSLNAWPNPFNPSVTVSVSGYASGDKLKIEIFDMSGRLVTIVNAPAHGAYASWDGTNAVGKHVSSGLYFIRARIDGKFICKTILLSK